MVAAINCRQNKNEKKSRLWPSDDCERLSSWRTKAPAVALDHKAELEAAGHENSQTRTSLFCHCSVRRVKVIKCAEKRPHFLSALSDVTKGTASSLQLVIIGASLVPDSLVFVPVRTGSSHKQCFE